MQTTAITDIRDANLPMDGEGRTYHLGLKKGELANRVLFVGDPDRAKLIRDNCLDKTTNVFQHSSHRGFETYTSTKNGVPVSIMSIGMGLAMMNFAVTESTLITEGPKAFIRLGSCGTPNTNIPIGTVVAATKSVLAQTNYDAFRPAANLRYYNITQPVEPDTSLHRLMVDRLLANANQVYPVKEASDVTADNFYGSQGRVVPGFEYQNEGLIDEIMQADETTGSLQMETFELFHLAKIYNSTGKIHTAASAIVLAHRRSNGFLSNETKHKIEILSGNACLEALTMHKL